MSPMMEPFGSVETIWCVWIASTALVLASTALALRRGRPVRLSRIRADEDGAAYTLAYVMAFPVYAMLVGLVIESTLILVTKVGTNYAAYHGARGAIVHWPDRTTEEARRSAVIAFVPFASSAKELRGPAGSAIIGGEAGQYTSAYKAIGARSVSDRYLAAKFRSAATTLAVSVDENPMGHQADLTVTVKYPFPFHIPGIGRILGKKGGDGLYVFPVASRATLRSESPDNQEHELGISYASAP